MKDYKVIELDMPRVELLRLLSKKLKAYNVLEIVLPLVGHLRLLSKDLNDYKLTAQILTLVGQLRNLSSGKIKSGEKVHSSKSTVITAVETLEQI